MALVEYLPMPVADPTTGEVREDLFGAKVTLVETGTNTPLTGLMEKGSGVPVANPVTVSPIGYTPWLVKEDGPARIDAVSGSFRTPLWSPSGYEAYMVEAKQDSAAARAAAETARDAAVQAATGATAPADSQIATLIGSPGSQSRQQVVSLIETTAGPGGGVSSWAEIEALPDVPAAFPTNADVVTETPARKVLTATERTKLAGVAAGATANRADTVTDQILAGKATDARRVVVYFNTTTWSWPAAPTLLPGQYIAWDAFDVIITDRPIPYPPFGERHRYNPASNDPIREQAA
jgi:hypothetical protein